MLHIIDCFPATNMSRNQVAHGVAAILRLIDNRFLRYSHQDLHTSIGNALLMGSRITTAAMPVRAGVLIDHSISQPPFHPQLFPETKQCLNPVCGQSLSSIAMQELGDGLVLHTHAHGPQSCSVFKVICSACQTSHHYSHFVVPTKWLFSFSRGSGATIPLIVGHWGWCRAPRFRHCPH